MANICGIVWLPMALDSLETDILLWARSEERVFALTAWVAI